MLRISVAIHAGEGIVYEFFGEVQGLCLRTRNRIYKHLNEYPTDGIRSTMNFGKSTIRVMHSFFVSWIEWLLALLGRLPTQCDMHEDSAYEIVSYAWPSLVCWPLRVAILQPSIYQPDASADLLRRFLSIIYGRRERSVHPVAPLLGSDIYDYFVLPEAFLRTSDFVKLLETLKKGNLPGWIHLGLHGPGNSHVFGVNDTKTLIRMCRGLADVREDIDQFSSWFEKAERRAQLNLAAVVGIDSDKNLRICIHPKLVAARNEDALDPSQAIEEGNLLVSLTLFDPRRPARSIRILPLICADLCCRPRGNRRLRLPLATASDAFKEDFDIVSAVLATPSMPHARYMKQQFRLSFQLAGQGHFRGRFNRAAFVFSNYSMINENHGALSGVWISESSQGAMTFVKGAAQDGRFAAYCRTPRATEDPPRKNDEDWVYTEELNDLQDRHWDVTGMLATAAYSDDDIIVSFQLHEQTPNDRNSIRLAKWIVFPMGT